MHKITYIFIPLITVICFVILMCLHTQDFNPFEYLNVWSFIQAFVLAYISVAVFRIAKSASHAYSFLIVAGLVLSIFTVFSAFNFRGLGPLFSIDHPIPVLVVYGLICFAGVSCSIRVSKKSNAEQDPATNHFPAGESDE